MAKDYGGNGRGRTTPEAGTDTLDAAAAPQQEERAGKLPPLPSARRASAEPLPPPLGQDREFRREPRADVRERTRGRPAPDATPDAEDTTPRIAGLRLPGMVTRMSPGRKLWFAISFVAPVVLGGAYLFLIAPDEYVTEYRFSVRVPVGQPGSQAMGGATLSALFGGNPTPGTDLLDNYTVADYVDSAQAARDVNAKVNLRDVYNKPFDPLSRVGKEASSERLEKFWKKMVYANYDAASGLAVVRVKAYTPQDSYALATTLVTLSSDLVNNIGVRSQQDSVRFAQAQVDRANARVAQLRAQLEQFRRSNGTINPVEGLTKSNDALNNVLQQRRVQIVGQIAALQSELRNPNAPQLVLLRQQLDATDRQLAETRGAVTRTGQLASAVTRFEELQTQLKDATTIATATNNVLAQAQAVADSQRLYLTTYVKPTMPESPSAPNRWLDLLVLTALAGMTWIIGRLIGNSIMEHG